MGSTSRIAAAVLGVCLTGCTGDGSAPAPSASPSPPACTPDTGTVTWDEPVATRTLLHVAARFLDDDRTVWRDLLDRPFTPEVAGDGADRSWIPALARSLGEARNMNLGVDTSPPNELEHLHTMLEGSTQRGWVLGYTGTSVVEAVFRVSCGADGATPVTGTLTTWHSIDAGFLPCADPEARKQPTDYPDAWSYCPTD